MIQSTYTSSEEREATGQIETWVKMLLASLQCLYNKVTEARPTALWLATALYMHAC